MSDETVAALIRSEGITEEEITAYIAANACTRLDAVKHLYSIKRATKIADAMFAVPVPPTDEQLAQIEAQRVRIEGIIAEQRAKEARRVELRTQIADAVDDHVCAKCAMYAELVSL
jgi:hypothetical protein